MPHLSHTAVTVLALLLAVAHAGTVVVPASSPSVRVTGRHKPLANGEVAFDQVGVSFAFNISGTSNITFLVRAFVSDPGFQPNYFQVVVDGGRLPFPRPVTAKVNTTTQELVLATGLDPSSSHAIEVVKSTEAEWAGLNPVPNYLTAVGFRLAGPATPAVAASPPPRPTRRLEFVGDSITAGYCNLCLEYPDFKGVQQESFYDSWASQICRDLDAECHATAWSGFGLVRNCCGGDIPLPVIYRRTLATVNDEDWDFSSWVPDGVIVNLGTNDRVPTDPSDPFIPIFTNTYVELVTNISSWYDHKVTLFLATGPMSTAYAAEVNATIAKATALGIKAEFLNQMDVLNDTNRCCGHPSVQADTIIAKRNSAFIENTLWG